MKKVAAVLISMIFGFMAVACMRVYNADDAVFDSELMFSARLYGDDAKSAYSEMLGVMDRLAESADTTNPSSTVSKVNAAETGEAVTVDGIFCELTQKAVELYYETDGAFNIFLQPLSELWGVDAETIANYTPTALDPQGSSPQTLPDADAIAELMQYANPQSFTLTVDGEMGTIVKSAPVMFDFGGLAKGWAIDRCVEIAERYGIKSAKLDLSGNLALVNGYYDENKGAFVDWTVGINDPRPADLLFRYYVMAFSTVGNVSIVTSGDYERYYYYRYENRDNIRVTHIIGTDGIPIGLYRAADGTYMSKTHVISATVLGDCSMLCDAYATAACVMGLEAGAEFLREKGCDAVLFASDGSMKIVGDVTPCNTDTYDGYRKYEQV